jgi:glycine/D-amino acid oxidase-like deaminating enzyme
VDTARVVVVGAGAAGLSLACRLGEQGAEDVVLVAAPPGKHPPRSAPGAFPNEPDATWRHRTTQQWVEHAVELQRDDEHLLLTGQTPLAELLAVPAVDQLERFAVCLVHCSDADRVDRLRQRDGEKWSDAHVEAFLRWSAWLHRHHQDPTWMPEVIDRIHGWNKMRWDRVDAAVGANKWPSVEVIDTSELDLHQAVQALEQWIREHLETTVDQ